MDAGPRVWTWRLFASGLLLGAVGAVVRLPYFPTTATAQVMAAVGQTPEWSGPLGWGRAAGAAGGPKENWSQSAGERRVVQSRRAAGGTVDRRVRGSLLRTDCHVDPAARRRGRPVAVHRRRRPLHGPAVG